jgi:hypothetical protein
VIESESERSVAAQFRMIAEQSRTRKRAIYASKRARQRILFVNEETDAMSRRCMVTSGRLSSLAAMAFR